MSERGWSAGVQRTLALAWLLAMAALAWHQWRFWHEDRLDADIMALLPADEQAPEVDAATKQLADQAARRVIVMVGAPEWAQAQQAAAAWRQALEAQPSPLRTDTGLNASAFADSVGFYAPWRDRLLTPAQRAQLDTTPPETLAQSALAALFQPAARARLSQWTADPLGLWTEWWSARAGETRARPRDGALWLSVNGTEWVVSGWTLEGSAFRLDGNAAIGDALARAQAAAHQAVPSAQVLAAGVPLFAEAAAVQASFEINTIGWGSLAAVLLLAWLSFRSPLPIVAVAASLLIGCIAALSVTAAVFGRVHLVTLVFGASLAGVAEDYGIHWFASRQGDPAVPPGALMRRLLPGLLLALATSVLGYLALAVAPFPALRQMALFASVGLAAALATVVCWFPLLRGGVAGNRFAAAVAGSLARWPRLPGSARAWAVYAVLAAVAAACALRLHVNDDVRQLQSSPPELIQAQRQVAELLGVASPAQFYLVRGANEAQVLEREEALTARLQALVAQGDAGGQPALRGWSAVSDWVPSPARQVADAALTARVEAEVLARVNAALGESLARPAFAPQPLTVAQWLASPASQAGRALWLGPLGASGRSADAGGASVVLLRGLAGTALLPKLAAAAEGLEGVRWVDKPGEISALLSRYRVAMSALLLLSHAVVLAALLWRLGRGAWRAWLPTVIGSAVALAALGLLGQPWQLFNVLALLLLLGVGVDYGIFLYDHPDDGSAWLAVSVGAASTWLAFGLLGLSSTPALRSFGLTLLVGVATVALLAPCLRPRNWVA